MRRVIVVGGGAAGMMAAIFAARAGANVSLIERNEKLGKKLYITGKGRCNLTNAAEPEPFMRHILRNPRFMYSSLKKLDNNSLMDFVESLGVPLKIERGERVFPESDKSSDITRALTRELERLGVSVRLNSRVKSLIIENGECVGVTLFSGEALRGESVLLATGGVSYPLTGSTGDGHALAKLSGHEITPLTPALTPLETDETWCFALTGLSLKNVALRAYKDGRRLYSEQGEMLFTHFGLSGPLVITLSSILPVDCKGVRLYIDLKPALDSGTLDDRLVRDLTGMSRKSVETVLDGLEPHSLGTAILELAGIARTRQANSITREERVKLRELIKNLPLTVKSRRGFDEAIITRGGVGVKQVDPSTLRSKILPGLYFAGEMLDIDATTGGFNLQIAFSTGALAGASAAEE